MDTFPVLDGVAAPLKMINVDTDAIIPKQYLKTSSAPAWAIVPVSETALTATTCSENPYFVSQQAGLSQIKILVAGRQFSAAARRAARTLGAARISAPLRDLYVVRRTSSTQLFKTSFCRSGLAR